MNIEEMRRAGRVIVTPTGRVDSVTAPALDRLLTAVIQRGDLSIVVDLAGVEYISSMGLAALLAAAKKLKPAHGTLVLSGLNSRVRLVFEMSGFLRLFSTFPSVDAALAAG